MKSSLVDVIRLCNSHYIVCLQEHWLLPHELQSLNSKHCEFYDYGLSAVNLDNDILKGKSYGGTAILYRKSLESCVKGIDSHDPRIACISIETNIGSVVIICVYIAAEYGDDESFYNYMLTSATLESMLLDCMQK